jgi:hypothetical protein
MEIHAPHHPILTIKEALVHLCLITTGILIALSLEGTLEWWHHRELVQETRQNLQNEIRSNQKDIQTVLKGLVPTQTRFVHAIAVVSDLSASENTKEAASLFDPKGASLLSDASFAFLNTASYTTAGATGALGLMEYREAARYSAIYDLQALYVRLQDVAEKEMFASLMLTPECLRSRRRRKSLTLNGNFCWRWEASRRWPTLLISSMNCMGRP